MTLDMGRGFGLEHELQMLDINFDLEREQSRTLR